MPVVAFPVGDVTTPGEGELEGRSSVFAQLNSDELQGGARAQQFALARKGFIAHFARSPRCRSSSCLQVIGKPPPSGGDRQTLPRAVSFLRGSLSTQQTVNSNSCQIGLDAPPMLLARAGEADRVAKYPGKFCCTLECTLWDGQM
jgi:hypothetical protein